MHGQRLEAATEAGIMKGGKSPRCLVCPQKGQMARKHGTGPLEAEPLFGLVRLTADRRPEYDVHPTPIHVYQCQQCGFITLFSEDLEGDWKVRGQLYADEAERFLTEQRSRPPESEADGE